jgi:transcriptional regulator with XRE-family HTH domain
MLLPHIVICADSPSFLIRKDECRIIKQPHVLKILQWSNISAIAVLLLRHANNLSLKQLAAVIGITYQQMQKYEKGINRISASTLYELSGYFQTSTDFFYQDYKGESKIQPQLGFTGEGMKAASAFNQIPDPIIRKKVLSHILPTIKAFDHYYVEEAIQMRCKEMLESDGQ